MPLPAGALRLTGVSVPPAVLYLCVAALLVGAAPLPYGYYILLRVIACVVFAWGAVLTFDKGNRVLPWMLGALALLFNPIAKVHLQKEVWAMVDIGAAIFLVIAGRWILARRR